MTVRRLVECIEGEECGEVLVLCRSLPRVGDRSWEILRGLTCSHRVTLVCGTREEVSLGEWREMIGFVDCFVLHCPSLLRRVVSRFVGRVWEDGGHHLMGRQVKRNSDLLEVCELRYEKVVVMDRRMKGLAAYFECDELVEGYSVDDLAVVTVVDGLGVSSVA